MVAAHQRRRPAAAGRRRGRREPTAKSDPVVSSEASIAPQASGGARRRCRRTRDSGRRPPGTPALRAAPRPAFSWRTSRTRGSRRIRSRTTIDRVVRRAVVDDDHLVVLDRLAGDAVEARADVRRHVVDRDDDADGRSQHSGRRCWPGAGDATWGDPVQGPRRPRLSSSFTTTPTRESSGLPANRRRRPQVRAALGRVQTRTTGRCTDRASHAPTGDPPPRAGPERGRPRLQRARLAPSGPGQRAHPEPDRPRGDRRRRRLHRRLDGCRAGARRPRPSHPDHPPGERRSRRGPQHRRRPGDRTSSSPSSTPTTW